ncbi:MULTISPECIES: alpha/beta hydrolase [Collinsella]|uniref:alpha/beta hydrolase n=1 Tax=Collinsella TaxID=102106 RepID=UPI000B396E22|nr:MULTISPECIES: alpha/beta hydrolase [Collinsella]MBM6908336.1 alpha/beta hydrolase [Collinsella intestinalis]MBM6942221.1 alpha/beta hydrolase [Collinsella intestinalis]OUO64054.1 hypothetical protein B5F70_06800 [Collinsella sp. An268]
MLCERISLQTGGELITYVQDSEIGHGSYREKPALIICPGGAYLILATREGEPVAVEFMAHGFQCFVLRYTTGIDRVHPERPFNDRTPYPAQVLQLMEALHVVRMHAAAWHVDPKQVYTMGFSAGGHVCATEGARYADPALLRQLPFAVEGDELKPTGVLLGYPMLRANDEAWPASQDARDNTHAMYRALLGTAHPTSDQVRALEVRSYVTPDAAPTFIWGAVDDEVVDWHGALAYVRALADAGVSCEYHLFSRGGHGQPLDNVLTLKDNERRDGGLTLWIELALRWLAALREGAR